MDFYKITSTLIRPNKNIPWFSTGESMKKYHDVNFWNYVKKNWFWPGYLHLGTGIEGVRDEGFVTEIDDCTCYWIRYWYDKKYYDQYLSDEFVQKVMATEHDYWKNQGIIYKEKVENYPGKVTKNGFYYVGNHYRYSKHLNQ